MTQRERAELKEAVREAVRDELPIALTEVLSPMVRKSTSNALNHYRRGAILGWILLVIACLLLFYRIGQQSDANTKSNHRQDCILAGLIKTVRIGDTDAVRNDAYNEALHILEGSGACPQFAHKQPPPILPH